MSEMVDRATKALDAAIEASYGRYDYPPTTEQLVRVVIAAMRETTDDVLEILDDRLPDPYTSEETWQAMIEAALKE